MKTFTEDIYSRSLQRLRMSPEGGINKPGPHFDHAEKVPP